MRGRGSPPRTRDAVFERLLCSRSTSCSFGVGEPPLAVQCSAAATSAFPYNRLGLRRRRGGAPRAVPPPRPRGHRFVACSLTCQLVRYHAFASLVYKGAKGTITCTQVNYDIPEINCKLCLHIYFTVTEDVKIYFESYCIDIAIYDMLAAHGVRCDRTCLDVEVFVWLISYRKIFLTDLL